MILTCPSCDTKFKVNPKAIPSEGRMVKCAKCAHKWHAMPEDSDEQPRPAAEEEAPAPAPPPQPEPEPALEEEEDDRFGLSAIEDDLPPPPPPTQEAEDLPPLPPEDFEPTVQTKKRSPLKAWIGLGVFVVAFLSAGWFLQKQIVIAFPPAKAIYHSLGIKTDVVGYGLALSQPEVDREIKGDSSSLVISGTVTNETDEPISIPKLKGVLINTRKEPIHVWVFSADQEQALPGEAVKFQTKVTNPPRGAVSMTTTFITDDEAMTLTREVTDDDMPAGDSGDGMENGA